MGKKRTANKVEGVKNDSGNKSRVLSKIPKKKLAKGIFFVESTFNNIKILLTESNGNVVTTLTSSGLGFSSAKKATPYAASKVAETIAEKALAIGVKEVDIIIKGVGPGRESALRNIINRGFDVLSIKDRTPRPHNGPRRRKTRRV